MGRSFSRAPSPSRPPIHRRTLSSLLDTQGSGARRCCCILRPPTDSVCGSDRLDSWSLRQAGQAQLPSPLRARERTPSELGNSCPSYIYIYIHACILYLYRITEAHAYYISIIQQSPDYRYNIEILADEDPDTYTG